MSHQRDFAVVAGSLARLLARQPEPLVVVVGHLDLANFPELLPWTARIEQRCLVPLTQLLDEVARFDISLAPLETANPFCEAKSPIRCLTASAVGVPTIASDTQPLRDAIVAGETGLVAINEAAWQDALDRLCGDQQTRARMGISARHHAEAQFGWQAYRALAGRVFTGLADLSAG